MFSGIIGYKTITALAILSAVVSEGIGDAGLGFLAMGIVTGLACIGAAYAVASTGTGAISATTEKPDIFARVLIFVGLAEGIAIMGLIVALLIWINMPSLAVH